MNTIKTLKAIYYITGTIGILMAIPFYLAIYFHKSKKES
jgi:hypothetical protein